MITVKLQYTEAEGIDHLKSRENVIVPRVPGTITFSVLPKGWYGIVFSLFKICDSEPCDADYFVGYEGPSLGGPTTISVVFKDYDSAFNVEVVRSLLEERINKIKNTKYSYFVQIVYEACTGLEEYGVVAHSSYVPS